MWKAWIPANHQRHIRPQWLDPDRGDARVHCTATKAGVKKESKESSRRTNNVLADIFPQVQSHKYF